MRARAATQIEIDHYNQLVGKTVKAVEFQDFDGQPLPVLKFTDGSVAAVLRDPEGNGPGFMDIQPPLKPDKVRYRIATNDGRWVSQIGPTPCLVRVEALAYVWNTEEEATQILDRYALFFGASSPKYRRTSALALVVQQVPV